MLPAFLFLLLILTNLKQINEYERGVVFTMGKYVGIRGSGWTFLVPIFQSIQIIDIRTKTVDLPDQQGVTGDNVSISVGAVVFFKVNDASKAVLEVENFVWGISQLAETTMRTVIGEVKLNELLAHRDRVAQRIEGIVRPPAAEWGVEIVSVELKDIVMPEDMKRTMAKLAEAEREKLSVITKAEGELIAAENLAKAAHMMSETPGALHLRTLSTINDLSSDQSNTIIFAIPVEILRAFDGLGKSASSNKASMSSEMIQGFIENLVDKNSSKKVDSSKSEG
jgi:regulator of protease activity HflC (stomatin/prohibitin superfamily)